MLFAGIASTRNRSELLLDLFHECWTVLLLWNLSLHDIHVKHITKSRLLVFCKACPKHHRRSMSKSCILHHIGFQRCLPSQRRSRCSVRQVDVVHSVSRPSDSNLVLLFIKYLPGLRNICQSSTVGVRIPLPCSLIVKKQRGRSALVLFNSPTTCLYVRVISSSKSSS